MSRERERISRWTIHIIYYSFEIKSLEAKNLRLFITYKQPQFHTNYINVLLPYHGINRSINEKLPFHLRCIEIRTSIDHNSSGGIRISGRGSFEAELLTPSKLVISTGVVVGGAWLEAGQLGPVQETWVSVAEVNGWRATHVTGTVAVAVRLCVLVC